MKTTLHYRWSKYPFKQDVYFAFLPCAVIAVILITLFLTLFPKR